MARIENLTAEEEMITRSGQLQRDIQKACQEGTYGSRVKIVGIPKEPPTKKQIHELLAELDANRSIPSFKVKKLAINSPDIDLTSEVIDVKGVTLHMQECAKQVWEDAFQNEILKAIPASNRFVLRRCPAAEMLITADPRAEFVSHPYARRVNFFGKVVPPFLPGRFDINPKYMKAAKMVVGFNRDIVHFVMPEPERWACEIAWRNVRDREYNPEGTVGFYRALMTYGAKVVRPDLGYVFTVLPPGIKGWLWEKVWKLFKFVP